jgi:DNA-binding SARP family transcriptional activator
MIPWLHPGGGGDHPADDRPSSSAIPRGRHVGRPRPRGRRARAAAARLLSDAGRWDEALDVALRGLQEDPLHEPFAVHQLQALLALDRRGEVRRAYDRFATRFRQELDLLPSDTLMALAEGRERDTAP